MARLSVAQWYLVVYNLAQAAGWGLCLVQLITVAAERGTYQQMYNSAEWTVRWIQCVAAVEILHAATGLVRSNPMMNFLQWLGKANALYRLAAAIPELQQLPATPLMLAMWSIGEVIRYPWYALTDLGVCPGWLTWLRYSAFLALYPTGVVCEMVLMYLGIPYLREHQLFSVHLPNKWNFSWHHDIFLQIMFYLYPFLWWQLFSTLLRQRKSRLGGGAGAGGSSTSSGSSTKADASSKQE